MKIKRLIKNCLFRCFCYNKKDFLKSYEEEYTIDQNKCDAIYSTSCLLKFECNGEKFFRFGRVVDKSNGFRNYIIREMRVFFFDIIRHQKAEEICNDIQYDISNKENYKKLFKVSEVFSAHFDEIVSNTFCSFELIGIPSVNQYDLIGKEKYLMQFVRSIIIDISHTLHLKNGSISNFSACRQKATYELANLFGIEHLIPKVQIAKVDYGGKTLFGTVMERGGDLSPAYLQKDKRKNYDSNFIKDITTLEFFDSICYQLDHRLDNYNVCFINGFIHSISAFDNDENMTFFPSLLLPPKTYAGCSSIVNKKGFINRPYIDHLFFESILKVSYRDIKNKLNRYLTTAQILSLWIRINSFKKMLIKTSKHSNNFVVFNWDNVDVAVYNQGVYGVSYLQLYLNDTSLLDRIERLGA